MNVKPINITRAGAFITPPIPFHLGFAGSAPEIPKLIYWVEVEKDGQRHQGIASDFAMYKWFDKSNDEQTYLDAVTLTASHAVETVRDHYNGREFKPFTSAQVRGDEFRDMSLEHQTTRLALQMVGALEERAILDAVSRSYDQNAFDFLINNDGFDLNEMDGVAGVSITDILRDSSSVPEYLPFRHTVGLDDHIRESDAGHGEQSLEAEIKQYGINRFKVKVDNRIDRSIDRLVAMADVIEQNVGTDYVLTLDGNESLGWEELLTFADRFSNTPQLANMKKNTTYIEQPFHRDDLSSIDETGRDALRQLKDRYGLDVLIDESGGDHNSYQVAIGHGIKGGGTKLCKGVYKAIYDAALARAYGNGCFISAEDLTVAEPSDLPQSIHLYSTMVGIDDAELNGAFKTESGNWMTPEEKALAVKHMPSLYWLDGEQLKVKLEGNQYPTKHVLGPGLGSPVVCFDPTRDVPDLRRTIKYVA